MGAAPVNAGDTMMLGKAMIYLDTSLVVALLIPGEQFERRLQDSGRVLRPGKPCLWPLFCTAAAPA
jgi:hypothetical protein